MSKQQLTLNDFIKNVNQSTTDIFDLIGYKRPNSKEAFLKLGAKIQSNTLAFKTPEVKIKNETIQKVWNQLVKTNKFLEIIQQLETNLYRNGIYAMGISKNNIINLGKVEKYKIYANKLIQLSVVVDTINHSDQQYDIIKEYDLLNNKNDSISDNFVTIYAKNKITKKIVSLDKFDGADFDYLIENKEDYIPWVVFKNNYLGNSEIDDVDSCLFEMLDNCLECVLRDNFWSNPFIFITDNFQTDSAQNIKEAVYDFGKRVIQSNSLSFNSVANPIEFHQGTSNTQFIIQKIDKLNYLIKDQMFFKMNSADFGTKNMHNAEFENLNSNFKDYVESKANVREEYYSDFVSLFLKILFKSDVEFEVIVPNSTKYLKSNDAIYQTDLNGVLLTPNKPVQERPKQEKDGKNND